MINVGETDNFITYLYYCIVDNNNKIKEYELKRLQLS